LGAARSRLDGGVFQDEIAAAAHWRLQDAEYTVAPGVHAIASPGHTAGHMSLLIELPSGRPLILCGDAADLRENLDDEVAPGYCWKGNDALALASICKLKALAKAENAELWPNHDFAAFRSWPSFPIWRD
jgi:N-acyl homoserine lactone hydrolase